MTSAVAVAVADWRNGAARLGAVGGWRRAAILAALGVLATLTLPPLHLVPLLWVSFSGLALMLNGAEPRGRAFGTGFWFGWAIIPRASIGSPMPCWSIRKNSAG